MKNVVEVELRARVSTNIPKKLKAKLLKNSKEHDFYFRYKTDFEKLWIARIRNKGNRCFLTYKSNKEFGEGAWDEVNIPLTKKTANQLASFFAGNDHNLEVEIIKKRKTYKINGMEINVDEIERLGTYIEAEVITDSDHIEEAKLKIKSFFKDLGIPAKNITNKGYVGLMRDKNNGVTF